MSTAVAEPLTETNPNRPTKPDTCYNCGSTGACKKGREKYSCECAMAPRPLTLERHEADERWAAIKAMTSAQREAVLQLLARLNPEDFDFAYQRRVAS